MRIFKAISIFFRVLFNRELANKLDSLAQVERQQEQKLIAYEKEKADLLVEIQKLKSSDKKTEGSFEEGACALLSLLQSESRFIDFVQESLEGLDDERVGSVSRQIQQELKKTFQRYLKLEPVFAAEEGKTVQVSADNFLPAQLRLSGNVDVQPPFSGTLLHKGWVLNQINLPKKSRSDTWRILQPAEIETSKGV